MPKLKLMGVIFLTILLFAPVGVSACASSCFAHTWVSTAKWQVKTPSNALFTGKAVFYAPGVMEEVLANRMQENGVIADKVSTTRFLGYVSAMSPGDLGMTVWIKRSADNIWEGPYLVVDCAKQEHIYRAIVVVDEILEVDFDTAVRWGMVNTTNGNDWVSTNYWYQNLTVYFGDSPPNPQTPKAIIDYSTWWQRQPD